MRKITFRRERNFYGRSQRAIGGVIDALARQPIQEWFCNDCGFVPVSEIRRESDEATSGVCKCGRKIEEIPF